MFYRMSTKGGEGREGGREDGERRRGFEMEGGGAEKGRKETGERMRGERQ